MQPTDLTVEILKGIRAEIKGVKDEVKAVRDEVKGVRDDLNARVDTTNDRLDRLERRQTATEVRLATELAGVTGAVREVRDLLREDCALRSRVDDHERRIVAIEHRDG